LAIQPSLVISQINLEIIKATHAHLKTEGTIF